MPQEEPNRILFRCLFRVSTGPMAAITRQLSMYRNQSVGIQFCGPVAMAACSKYSIKLLHTIRDTRLPSAVPNVCL